MIKRRRIWHGIALFLTAAVLVGISLSQTPWVRGHVSHDPKILGWQWRREPHFSWMALAWMAGFGLVALVATLWRVKHLARVGMVGRFFLIGAACLGFQMAAVSLRVPELQKSLAWRTTVDFLEDFFPAAQDLDRPSDAYTRLDSVRAQMNHARVGTHPPGMIFLYRGLMDIFPNSGMTRSGVFKKVKHWFQKDDSTRGFSDADFFALIAGTGIKWGGLLMILGGVGFMIAALANAGIGTREVVPPAMALAGLTPGIALFSICLDQLIAGFSTLAIGLLMWSAVGSLRRMLIAAPIAGMLFFLQSQLGYQVLVSLWIGIATVGLLAIMQRHWNLRRRCAGAVAIVVAVLAALLAGLYFATGYNYVSDLALGMANHHHHPSQMYRSRTAWLFYNQWDMILFLGFGWLCLGWKTGVGRLVRNPLAIAVVLAWAIVIARDSVRGETARIMLFFFPAMIAVICSEVREEKRSDWVAAGGLLVVQSVGMAIVLNLF